MKSQKLIAMFLCVIAMTFSGPAHAGKVKENQIGRGEAAVVDITPPEGRLIALQRARADAIEKAAGTSILSTTVVTQGRLVGQFLEAYSRGYIVEEHVLKMDMTSIDDGLTPKYITEISAAVEVPEKKIDPDFLLEADLSRVSFMAGDSAVLTIKASKKAYLGIFNIMANDRIRMIYPDETKVGDRAIEPKIPFVFPPKDSGAILEMATLHGHKRDSEAFFIVAYQPQGDRTFSFGNIFSTSKEYTVPEFFKLYSRVSDKTLEVIKPYEVRKKGGE